MVGIKVVEDHMFAYIDFEGSDTAAAIVSKSHEQPFCVGEDKLHVDVKRMGNRFNRNRINPKRE